MTNTQTPTRYTFRELGERAGMTRGELRTALDDGALPPECVSKTATGRRYVSDLEAAGVALSRWREERAARDIAANGRALPQDASLPLLATAARLREEAARLEALAGGDQHTRPGADRLTRPVPGAFALTTRAPAPT